MDAGPSGAGESTLRRAVDRLETVRSGTVLLDGQPLPGTTGAEGLD